jgi:integrase
MSETEHKTYDDYHDLRGDGRIVIYKRRDHHNPRWNVRIKVPGKTGYVVKSCKTTDFHEARRFSEDLYYELEGRSRRGESIRSHKFDRVVKEWERDYPSLMKGRSDQYIKGNIQRVKKHLVPFFRNHPIEVVNEDLMTDYFLSRQSNDPEPSNVTLRHEGTVLRHILKFSKRKGYVSEVPEIPQPKMKVSPRPDIPRDDWKKLYKYLRKYVSQSQDKRRYRERLYLQNWTLVMGNTGIRVGEMRNVRWSDVGSVKTTDGNERVSIFVDGKTGPRTVISNEGVEVYLTRIWDQRKEELGKEPPRTEPVFCNRDGKPIQSFKKGFERVLSECGILYQEDGKKRVPYSLRHTYATMRITEGVNVYQLASNMGTSIDMIEMYYGKKRTSDPMNVTEITKMTSRSRKGVKDKDPDRPWLN